jgi:hypothetical protein
MLSNCMFFSCMLPVAGKGMIATWASLPSFPVIWYEATRIPSG